PQHLHIHPDEVRHEISRLQPDIVLLHERKDGSGIALIPLIKREVSDALIIYLAERRDPIRARDVNRAGAFDLLFLPEEINALEDVLGRALRAWQLGSGSREAAAEFSWGRGQVVAFTSGKDRKSTRLNSSHVKISYAVFCLKKKISCKTETLLS